MSNYRIEDRLKAMGYDPSTLEENDKIAIATNLNYLHDEYIEEIAENPWYVPGGVINIYDDKYVPVTSIIINEEIPKLNVGDTYTINATVKPDNASFKQLLYKSGDESIVTIDKNGKITSKAVGTTTITVISDDNEAITAEATVEVKIGVTSVTVSGAELVKTGNPQQLSVVVEPEDATHKEVTWSSSNENVATVNDNGLVTAISGGNVTITTTSIDNPSAKGTHNMISKISVTSVDIQEESVEINSGDTTQLHVTVLPENATDKTVTWTSSDTNIATVDDAGLVAGVGDGEVEITVTSKDNTSLTDTCTIVSKINYSRNYFTTVVTTGGDITWTGTNNNALSYSTDNGTTWSTPSQDITLQVNENDKVLWKGTTTPIEDDGIGKFSGDTDVRYSVEGNIMSLLFGDDFKGQTSLNGKDYAFYVLFSGNTNVTSTENLSLPATTLVNSCYRYMFESCTNLTTAPSVLPATTLTNECYSDMFNGCTSLTTAPQLPAITLDVQCYQEMFRNCTSLTTAPQLPATTLAESCYSEMFNGCTNLTTAPELPATTLAESCYEYMFSSCTSLTTAPELPATTLADYCYSKMFQYCTSLTTAPELPATTLAVDCYYYMFSECTNLNSITCLATNISATECTKNWVKNVASNGTFTKAASMTSWVTGTWGIPSGWTVVDAN